MFGGLENYPYLCITIMGWGSVGGSMRFIAEGILRPALYFFIKVLLNNPRPFWWIEILSLSLLKIYTP